MRSYKHVSADGRYVFHESDGQEVVVDSDGFTTDDPVLIHHLDGCPFVTETTAAKPRAGKPRAGKPRDVAPAGEES